MSFKKGNKICVGRMISEETKRKIGLAQKGNTVRRGAKHTEETKQKIKEKRALQVITEETKRKISLANKGKILSLRARINISNGKKGSKNPMWEGGKTKISMTVRHSLEYRLWREAVFKRDNYTCIWCGQKGGKLEADHIKRFSDYPALRFAIDNGRTLCIDCHKNTDNYGRKKKIHN